MSISRLIFSHLEHQKRHPRRGSKQKRTQKMLMEFLTKAKLKLQKMFLQLKAKLRCVQKK